MSLERSGHGEDVAAHTYRQPTTTGETEQTAAQPDGLVISVVIPTYRMHQSVRKTVLSLFEQDLDKERYEVIVVDSSPDDETAAVIHELKATAPCALHYYRKTAEGPGPSRNLGATHASGTYIAFIDSDCTASPGWLCAGVAAFSDGAGIVQGRTLAEPGKPLGILKHTLIVEEESFFYQTANIFYRRESFEQAGGFTPDLTPRSAKPMGGEDVDLAWRVKESGWNSTFASDAIVYHDVLTLPATSWIWIKHLYIVPWLIKRHPQLRTFFYGRYFFDKAQATLTLAFAGIALGWWSPVGLILTLPYVAVRASEPSRTLVGILRPLRVPVYLLRDLSSFALLVAGSARFRTVLL